MARPHRGVTLENMYYVDSYFYRALKDRRLFETEESDENWGFYDNANEAFNTLPSINRKNEETKKATTEERRIALQEWVDKYISSKKWQRCLMTLRQDKSRKKLKLKSLDLTLDVYLVVKNLAEKMGMTIGEAIYDIAKPALDKLYADELQAAQSETSK